MPGVRGRRVGALWRVGLILEVHGVVGLVIQEPLLFEEVLAALEGRLLLHLLEGIGASLCVGLPRAAAGLVSLGAAAAEILVLIL